VKWPAKNSSIVKIRRSIEHGWDIKIRFSEGRSTIKVKVYAPAFVNHDPIDVDGTVWLEDGAKLHELYRRLHLPLPLRLSFFCSVNYEPAKWNRKLSDGDIVTFLFPISGG
jgi:molybdopterin converting factor small subunit